MVWLRLLEKFGFMDPLITHNFRMSCGNLSTLWLAADCGLMAAIHESAACCSSKLQHVGQSSCSHPASEAQKVGQVQNWLWIVALGHNTWKCKIQMPRQAGFKGHTLWLSATMHKSHAMDCGWLLQSVACSKRVKSATPALKLLNQSLCESEIHLPLGHLNKCPGNFKSWCIGMLTCHVWSLGCDVNWDFERFLGLDQNVGQWHWIQLKAHSWIKTSLAASGLNVFVWHEVGMKISELPMEGCMWLGKLNLLPLQISFACFFLCVACHHLPFHFHINQWCTRCARLLNFLGLHCNPVHHSDKWKQLSCEWSWCFGHMLFLCGCSISMLTTTFLLMAKCGKPSLNALLHQQRPCLLHLKRKQSLSCQK